MRIVPVLALAASAFTAPALADSNPAKIRLTAQSNKASS